MKRLLVIVLLFISAVLNAQNSTLTADSYSVTALLSNFRNIKSHINLEFAASANAHFTNGKFDDTLSRSTG